MYRTAYQTNIVKYPTGTLKTQVVENWIALFPRSCSSITHLVATICRITQIRNTQDLGFVPYSFSLSCSCPSALGYVSPRTAILPLKCSKPIFSSTSPSLRPNAYASLILFITQATYHPLHLPPHCHHSDFRKHHSFYLLVVFLPLQYKLHWGRSYMFFVYYSILSMYIWHRMDTQMFAEFEYAMPLLCLKSQWISLHMELYSHY